MLTKSTTIVAPATPPGRGGIGIIRVSGPEVRHIAKAILGDAPTPRYAVYRNFRNAVGDIIDAGLALFFPAPRSFTGEDTLELHGHGGPMVMDLLLQRIIELGAQPAKPGEFSQRAFLNGKLDLVQLEAIADLIDSASEQAVRCAQRSLQGEFSRTIHALMDRLAVLRSYIEAAIDFPDDEIDLLSTDDTRHRLTGIIQHLERILGAAKQGALLHEGLGIVIAGRPNVGKSSLLNILAGRDTAIVTDIPGTTRDVLREHIHIDGCPIHLFDTAGLRQSSDQVERHGIQRALDTIQNADILLLVTDSVNTLPHRDKETLANFHGVAIIIRNKIDLIGKHPEALTGSYGREVHLSAKTGAGLNLLRAELKTGFGLQQGAEGIFLARRRHLAALQQTRQFLHSARQQLITLQAGELVAEDLRQAQQSLGEITGQYTTEDLLERIFSSFCIGK